MTDAPLVPAVQAYFQPPPADAVAGTTLVVVDTLRATTVITTLIAGGAAAVYPCGSIAEARALAQRLAGCHTCGEAEGLPVAGFEYGNSPSALAAVDVRGWEVVQATTNGTRVLALAAGAGETLVGCLRNRLAVAEAAFAPMRRSVLHGVLAATRGPRGVAVVCAGERGGVEPSVEDAFTAGGIVDALVAAAMQDDGSYALRLSGGARLASRLFHAYRRSPGVAFASSPHAERLRALGYAADLEFAGAMDVETCVPRARLEQGRVVVRRAAEG